MKNIALLIVIPLYFLANPIISAQDCLTFWSSSEIVQSGDTVQLDIRVKEFNTIISTQYTMMYEPADLEFIEIGNFNLPDLEAANFGIFPTAGRLTFSWLDFLLDGVTMADSSVIYSLWFKVLTPNGTTATLSFEDALTPVEVVQRLPEGDYPRFPSFIDGQVHAHANSGLNLPSIETICPQAANCSSSNTTNRIDLEVSGGTPPYTYSWVNDAGQSFTTEDLEDIPEGNYEVTVTDQNGLEASGLVGLFSNDPNQFVIEAITNDATCEDGSNGSINLDVTGGSGQYSYEWSTGSTSATIDGLSPGLFLVTITDDVSGCSAIKSYIINQDSGIDVSINVHHPTCGQANGAIELLLPNPANYTIEWTGYPDSTSTLSGLATGTYTVEISENNTGCVDVRSIELSEALFIPGTSYQCQFFGDDSVLVSPSVVVWSGGRPPYTFAWSDGSVQVDSLLSTITSSTPGNSPVTFSVSITDATGCTYPPVTIETDCVNSNNEVEISATSAATEVGESVCIPVTVENFQSILGMQLSMHWAPEVIRFDSISNINLPSVDSTNFGTPDELEPGTLTFSWADNTQNGISLPDDEVLFELCFTAIGSGCSPVTFSDSPTPIQFYGLDQTELPFNTISGTVNTSGEPGGAGNLLLTVSDATAQVGETVCLDITANGFDNIASLQFGMEWDASKLAYASIQGFGLPDLTQSNFNPEDELEEGILRFSWLDNATQGVTLSDNSVLFQVCLTALDGPANETISFTNDPVPQEAVNGNLELLNVLTGNGVISIQVPGTTGVQLFIDEATAIPGEEVCLPVTCQNFTDVAAMQFSINWDPDIIDYSDLVLGDLDGLELSSFGTLEVEEGALRVAWFDPGTTGNTLPDGTTLFEICFVPTGPAGISPVTFSNEPILIEFTDGETNNIPFAGTNGQVTVPDDLVWPGDTDQSEVVNHFDLLNIGLAYGSSGTPRADGNVEWMAQYAEEWDQETPENGINFKHADTDGNGLVDANDTLAIIQNWGEVTDFWNGEELEQFGNPEETGLTNVPIYVLPDTIIPGETVDFSIILGNENIPANDVYGIAFTIVYDPEVIVENSVSARFMESWMGVVDTDLLGIYRDNYANNKIDVAITRTDLNNVSGQGKIGALQVTIEDVIFQRSQSYEMQFDIENVRLIDAQEQEIPVTAKQSSTMIIDETTDTHTPEWARSINLYPIPTRDYLYMDAAPLQIEALHLYSIEGKRVRQFDPKQHSMNMTDLPDGIYLLQIITEQGVVSRKVEKQ